jgi:hypothetical protein
MTPRTSASCTRFDLGGHGWQGMWMDPAAAQPGSEAAMQEADAPA